MDGSCHTRLPEAPRCHGTPHALAGLCATALSLTAIRGVTLALLTSAILARRTPACRLWRGPRTHVWDG